jgi:hypothetical protein
MADSIRTLIPIVIVVAQGVRSVAVSEDFRG